MLEKFTWYKQSAYKWKGDGVTMYIDPWGLKANEEPADIIFIMSAISASDCSFLSLVMHGCRPALSLASM